MKVAALFTAPVMVALFSTSPVPEIATVPEIRLLLNDCAAADGSAAVELAVIGRGAGGVGQQPRDRSVCRVVEGSGVRHRAGPGAVIVQRAAIVVGIADPRRIGSVVDGTGGVAENVAGPYPRRGVGDGAGVGRDVGVVGQIVGDRPDIVEIIVDNTVIDDRGAKIVGDAGGGGQRAGGVDVDECQNW